MQATLLFVLDLLRQLSDLLHHLVASIRQHLRAGGFNAILSAKVDGAFEFFQLGGDFLCQSLDPLFLLLVP